MYPIYGLSQGFRSTSSPNLSTDLVHQVDARYPALLFKQQLTAYVETMYGIIRENFKREVSSLLSSCIQVYTFGDRPNKLNL